MNRLRSWSHRAYVLHVYLIVTLALLPVQRLSSNWIDTDNDTVNDAWQDSSNVVHSLSALDAQEQDIDHDGAYNNEELNYGSDPFAYDTDDDGLNDGDEIHLANEQGGKGYSLTDWDSNGDEVSDHDDFYNCFNVTYPNGELPNFSGATYFDYDGDGIKNPSDPYPTDPYNNDADGDDIDDNIDPVLGDPSNTSAANGQPWGSSALDDNDHDGIANFFDAWPEDPTNGSLDSDGDGYPNESDPFPDDHDNYCALNGITWGNTLFDDGDQDGVQNYLDQWPYDSTNGWSTQDDDADGIENDLDPLPGDADNYSEANQTAWGGLALEDADEDGQANFYDPYPYDTYDNIPDYDGDGWLNADDPFPKDFNNYSDLNQTAWGNTLFDDQDGDGAVNWADPFPDDPYDGNPDYDGDNISNEEDPYPADNMNYSDVNGIQWLGTVNGDEDHDGIPNWNDPVPYSVDSDGDGFDDDIDPYVNDSSNTSNVNGITWGSSVIDDNDGDGIPNWNDPTPYPDNDIDDDGIDDTSDPYPSDPDNVSTINGITWGADVLGDSDHDGIPNWNDPDPLDSDGDGWSDGMDPFPSDPNNYSWINGIQWYGSVLNDDDGDSVLNWEDAWPTDANNGQIVNTDRDYDGYNNDIDPAPDDYSNYSMFNWLYWYSNALGDNDNDGTPNFYDYMPYEDANVDSDGDGYYDSIDPAPNDSSNYSYANGNWWYSNALGDEDADGISNFCDSTPYGDPPPPDNDGDGLDESVEQYWGTSDNDTDSDDDGLADGEEVNIYATHPANAYSISQARGWGNLYMDIDLVDLTDTDSDQIPDRIEQHYGLNPNWSKDALLDRDNDGVNNVTQYLAGIALDAHLDNYDADGDGMTDVFEDAYAQVLSKNNPADAVLDADGDGVLNYEEQILLISPMNADTLQQGGLGDLQVLMLSVRYPNGSNPPDEDSNPANGIPDWADAVKETPTAPDYYHFTRSASDDLDGDGMSDAWEHKYGRWKYSANGLQLRYDDAEADADGDGLPNLFECWIGTSPLAGDTDGNNVTDNDEDSDGDGLSNAQELALGTNALNADSDGDGVPDGLELAEGTDPTDASSNATSLIGLRVFTPLGAL